MFGAGKLTRNEDRISGFADRYSRLIIIITIIILIKDQWKNKTMHGQYIRNMVRQLMSEEDPFLWLSKGDLKAETESEKVAAQDQALQTKYYATKLLNTETDSKRRLCQKFDETIDHIISACPILAKDQYIRRHDSVKAQIHFNI
jgi:biopolymer transport protein ExbB/TolQ